MKTTGALILVAGLLFTIFTTFGFLEERFVRGTLSGLTPHTIHPDIWQPLFGAIIVMIGMWINTLGRRSAAATRMTH
jgi:hypothetical protein